MFWLKTPVGGLSLMLSALFLACTPLRAEDPVDGSDMPSTKTRRLPTLDILAQASDTEEWQTDWPVVLSLDLAAAGLKPADQPGLSVDAQRGAAPLPLAWKPIPAGLEATRSHWVLPARELAKAGPGTVSLTVSSAGRPVAALQLALVDKVANPGPESARQGLRAALGFASIQNDTTEMARVAAQFVARFPNDPDAHAAKGDALAAAGNDKDAAAAYLHAIELWGDDLDPPRHLLRRYNAAQGRLFAQATTTPYQAPSRAELQFFKTLREGDQAFDKGKYPQAVNSYERALTQVKNGKLKQETALIEARLAETRKLAEAQKQKKGGAK